MEHPLLEIKELSVRFSALQNRGQAVDRVSFSLNPGDMAALVGESGCGKSATALAIMGLLPLYNAKVTGEIRFSGRDLRGLSEHELTHIRGRDIAMVFQDPLTALNPVLTIGRQVSEVIEVHEPQVTRSAVHERTCALLDMVGIPRISEIVRSYPHQLSGGMRQRVLIAMALACQPKLLIADEPTTALDATVQAQILELLYKFNQDMKLTILLITHDLGVVAGLCDKVMVMYAGQLVEQAQVDDLFYDSRHPYSRMLLRSVPSLTRPLTTLHSIAGQPPEISRLPSGCRFHPRCPEAMVICKQQQPHDCAVGPDHTARCWLLHPQARRSNHD